MALFFLSKKFKNLTMRLKKCKKIINCLICVIDMYRTLVICLTALFAFSANAVYEKDALDERIDAFIQAYRTTPRPTEYAPYLSPLSPDAKHALLPLAKQLQGIRDEKTSDFQKDLDATLRQDDCTGVKVLKPFLDYAAN
jgi:hypothetical protein